MASELEVIVARVLAGAPVHRRALVAIDGVGGSGKSTFAELLAKQVRMRPVLVVHVDDFFNPTSVRHARGRRSPEGFWLDAYNYAALKSWALEPLRGGDDLYRASSFDPATGQVARPEPRAAPLNALVLVEGTFLHRDELARSWDYSIFLDVPFTETARRMASRDGSHPPPPPS